MKDIKLKEIEKAYNDYISNRNLQEIPMPVYFWEDEDCKACGNYGSIKDTQKLCTDCNGDGLKKHYDFEEMANELENRICKALNRNISITIHEVEEE